MVSALLVSESVSQEVTIHLAFFQITRFTEIRTDEDHAAAVAYFIKLNQSPEADAHLDEINALGGACRKLRDSEWTHPQRAP